jgi:hypothetical protein
MSVVEETIQAATQPKPKGRIRKFFFRALLTLAGVAVAAQLAFTLSGSGKWEYLGKRNGVTIYSMKVSGSNLQRFTAIVRVKSSLSRIVTFMQDNDSDIDVDFYKSRELKRESPQVMITTWRSGFPAPFKDRDFVVRHTFTQDARTREVTYLLKALPDMIPRESCCVRVPVMDNSWQLIPLKNGEVEIRWLINMDVGGFVPYFVMNQAQPDLMYDFASHLQEYFNRDKYANSKFDWLVEPQL